MKLTVIGAGSWGTAMAKVLSDSGHEVMLWVREPEILEMLLKNRKSPFMESARLPENIALTSRLEDAMVFSQILFNAVPVQYISGIYCEHSIRGKMLVNLSKGFELGSLKRPSEVYAGKGLKNFVALSGPSYAEEVAREVPTSIVAAAKDIESAREIRDLFHSGYLRVYSSSDLTGVEVAGAIKNVMAIAAGIIDGLGGWNNTKAALITRATAEIARLGIKIGGKPETFAGLAGVGDLVVTCTGKYSRNRRVGERLAAGEKLDKIVSGSRMVAEGVSTCKAIYELSQTVGVELPIVNQVYGILYESKDPVKAIRELMSRDLKDED